jgi:chaperone modulatory protein CbpM
MDTVEFLRDASINSKTLDIWIDAGWLVPGRFGDARQFGSVDLARVRLIHDLKNDLGVNDEGISVVLDLLDQIHGLRRALSQVLFAVTSHSDTQHVTKNAKTWSRISKRRRRLYHDPTS